MPPEKIKFTLSGVNNSAIYSYYSVKTSIFARDTEHDGEIFNFAINQDYLLTEHIDNTNILLPKYVK